MLGELRAADAGAVAALIVGANPRPGIDADDAAAERHRSVFRPADSRGLRVARPQSGCGRDPRSRGACPRERRVLAGGRVRGNPPPLGPVRARHPELAA